MGVQRTIPLFNLGRQDLPHVVLLCVFLASVALILRAGQGNHPAGTTAWRDLLVIFGTLGALVLCCLAVVKICYSYFSDSGVLSQGYAQLEEGEPVAKAHTHEVKPQQAAAPVPQPREVEPPRPVSDSVTPARSYRSFTPREEEDIECGLLLEASAVDFEYNGVRHQKGSLRVIKVERDGVCEVSSWFVIAGNQGSCAHVPCMPCASLSSLCHAHWCTRTQRVH